MMQALSLQMGGGVRPLKPPLFKPRKLKLTLQTLSYRHGPGFCNKGGCTPPTRRFLPVQAGLTVHRVMKNRTHLLQSCRLGPRHHAPTPRKKPNKNGVNKK